jgi:integrase
MGAEMRDLCKRLKIEPKITPHDLRRTWTTTAAALGADRETLMKVLNHVDDSVTAGYDRYGREPEIAALMERVARHVVSVASGESAAATVIPFSR